ncbi:hypothetical protein TB2_028487 [Malus domestica]
MVNLTVLQRNDPSSKRLMWKATPVTILFLLALMPWLDPPGVLLLKWDFNNSTAILTSAVLGFQLQWSFGTRQHIALLHDGKPVDELEHRDHEGQVLERGDVDMTDQEEEKDDNVEEE